MKLKLLVITLVASVALALPIKATAQENGLQDTYNPQQQAHLQEIEWSNQLVAYARSLEGKRLGQCVLTLRNYFGVPRSEVQGMAKNTKINSSTGKVGAVVVFKRMSWAGHVAIQITPVDSNGNFQYFAGNENRGRAVIKTININDPRISGYRIINKWI